ncbi:Fic family protein [Litorihabitans aurantiacus]|nr:Fic family protein [Litorihabitans aurantiacus]
MWVPTEGTLSRRAHAELAGKYRSALTPEVAGVEPHLSASAAARVGEAAVEMARFDAEASSIFGDSEIAPITSVLLRSESAASSQIEDLTVGARQLALAELTGLGGEASRNARTVSANVRAMRAALDLADDISEASILTMHETLLHGQERAMPGRYRDVPVWIGGRAPTEAAFVPPAPERVAVSMADLVALARRRQIPALAHVALVHAHFETIHPFVDGNGRTGRALAQSMLRGAGVTQRITVPVSAGLLADTDGYFLALGAYREGDLEPIILTFADAAETAVANGRRLVGDLHDVRETWRERVTARRDAAVWRALDVVIGQPVVDVRHVQRTLGVSYPTAQGAIDALEDAGALSPSVVGRQRNRVWHAPEVLDSLDAFASRAGRRRG